MSIVFECELTGVGSITGSELGFKSGVRATSSISMCFDPGIRGPSSNLPTKLKMYK
jgi:hypothetical protein